MLSQVFTTFVSRSYVRRRLFDIPITARSFQQHGSFFFLFSLLFPSSRPRDYRTLCPWTIPIDAAKEPFCHGEKWEPRKAEMLPSSNSVAQGNIKSGNEYETFFFLFLISYFFYYNDYDRRRREPDGQDFLDCLRPKSRFLDSINTSLCSWPRVKKKRKEKEWNKPGKRVPSIGGWIVFDLRKKGQMANPCRLMFQ